MKKKRKLLFLMLCSILLLFTGIAFANVGVFKGFGHSIELIKTESISMVEEDIIITPGRGRYLFDGSSDGMDRVEYLCKFKLKNLKNEVVVIKAGFPLSLQHGYKEKTSELVSGYNFIAQEDGKIYNVKFFPSDRNKKLKSLFVWDMHFDPNEEKDLLVTYSMPISMTLALTTNNFKPSKYEKEWYGYLETCLLEYFGYVTETGKSWAGTIIKAKFSVYIKGFERYLNSRPLLEGLNTEEEKDIAGEYPVVFPLFFRITEPSKWKADDKGFIRLSYENYKPDKNLIFFYYIVSFPKTENDLNRLIALLSNERF